MRPAPCPPPPPPEPPGSYLEGWGYNRPTGLGPYDHIGYARVAHPDFEDGAEIAINAGIDDPSLPYSALIYNGNPWAVVCGRLWGTPAQLLYLKATYPDSSTEEAVFDFHSTPPPP